MKNLSLIASALAMLGLTACEKGLVDGVADVAPAGHQEYYPTLLSTGI